MNTTGILQKKQAFTLTELLVVTAVIAILAAVALNQMSGAKIRSEIAKVKSDFNTIASAIMIYKLDHSSIPFAPYNLLGATPRYVQTMHELTTPTTYLSSIPVSPWAMKNMHVFNMLYGEERSERLAARGRGEVEDDWENRPDYQFTVGGSFVSRNAEWTLLSHGPTRIGNFVPYNPSNGIISAGGVFYTPQDGFTSILDL